MCVFKYIRLRRGRGMVKLWYHTLPFGMHGIVRQLTVWYHTVP